MNSIRSYKKLMVFKNANQFVFAEDTVIDLGGNVDFFIMADHIFIINVKSFENAFDYKDHIAELRDQNLAQIVSMPFFEGETSNKELFEESCKKFIQSRGLAQNNTLSGAILIYGGKDCEIHFESSWGLVHN